MKQPGTAEGHCPSLVTPSPCLGVLLSGQKYSWLSLTAQKLVFPGQEPPFNERQGAHIWLQARSDLRDEVILALSLMHPRLNTPTTPTKGAGAPPKYKKPGCLQ